MSFQRVKQVLFALQAKITFKDRNLVALYLNEQEQELFWGMALPDQYHALNVTKTAGRLAICRKDIDRNLLLRCCLLHDVGRRRGDVSTLDKIMAVLAYRLFSHLARKAARYGRGNKLQNLRHALYIYRHHPERSAQMLQGLGLYAEAAIVRRHHKPRQPEDCQELLLLRAADNKN